MLYNEKVLAKRVGTRTAFAVNFTRTESVYQMIKVIAIRRKENDMKKARIFAFVMLVVLAYRSARALLPARRLITLTCGP